MTLPRIRWPCWARSSSRPGVPTTISTPPCSACDLRLVGAAAVDGLHADAALGAGGGEVAGDLDAQLAGGDDDQRLRNAVAALGRRHDALQHRDAEAEGLAGAGAGLTDQVVAGQRQREGQLLDGEGAGDADLGQRRDDVGVDVEVAEQRGGLLDRRAAELLDDLLELLGIRGAGLGVLDLGGGGDVLEWGQCSRLRSAGGRLVDGGSAGPDLSRVGCSRDQFQRRLGQQTGRSEDGPGGEPAAGPVQRSSAHRYTYKRTDRLADSHGSARND